MSIFGNTKKAKLILHDRTADKINSLEQIDNALIGVFTPPTLSMFGGGYELSVQYNPASISVMANSSPVPVLSLQSHMDSAVPNQNVRPPAVVMSVELVFDEVNVRDAFNFSGTAMLSAGAVIQTIAALAKKGTVQPQTNGLLAALARESTRVVTFTWADMAFTGELTECQATYTMFTRDGRPIRSVVRLNICQQVESKADRSYWNKAVNSAFAPSEGGFGAFADAVSSVLNIPGL